jgi:hypothetical protein
MTNIIESIGFPNGNRLVLLDTMGKEEIFGAEKCAKNVFLLNSAGVTIWQISSNFDQDGDPFTKIIFENERIKAYRWDGGVYEVNLTDGKAVPIMLAR